MIAFICLSVLFPCVNVLLQPNLLWKIEVSFILYLIPHPSLAAVNFCFHESA